MAPHDEVFNPEHVARWLAVTRGYFCTDIETLDPRSKARRMAGWFGEAVPVAISLQGRRAVPKTVLFLIISSWSHPAWRFTAKLHRCEY